MSDANDVIPPDAHIGRVALRVGDLDRQIEFYEDVVGLETYNRDGETGVLGTADEPLFVFTERPDLPPRAADETGLFHAAVRLPSREALGDALVRVEDSWRLTGASDHLVSEALYLDDPEGNGLELYRDRPMSDWPIEDDGSVGMETRPLDLTAIRDHTQGGTRAPAGTTIGHVHLEVSDVDATSEFYTDGLGMRLRQTYGAEAIFLAAGDYHHHVGANVWNGRTEPGDGRGLDWFEVLVPDEGALDAARRRFEGVGADLADVDGGFAVEDPDEIELRIRVDSR